MLCAVLVFVVFIGVRFHAQVARYAHNALLVVRKPDIASVLHTLRQEDFGMLCVQSGAGADDCYVFDEDGIIFKSARMVVSDVIARVDDLSDFKPVVGAPVTDPDIWKNMMPIIAYAKETLPANRIQFARTEKELTIVLSDSGTRLYFNLRLDPEEHIRALKELQKTTPFDSLEYADLRVKGRVFYK